jgi:transposase
MTVTAASKKLGVTRATVYNLLKKIGGTEQWDTWVERVD